jgi:hypothetical protein
VRLVRPRLESPQPEGHDMNDMITPTGSEVRSALEEHAIQVDPDQWVFRTHLSNFYTEAEALELTRINLMLGTTPNGSITAGMLGAIVDRIAAVESRLRDLEYGEDSRRETEMGEDL